MEKKNRTQQTAESLYKSYRGGGAQKARGEAAQRSGARRRLGVSRATLREAIRTLCTRGVLEVRRGKGTYVSQRVGEIDDFGFSGVDYARGQLRDLFELRSIFEPRAARLACRRATEGELAEILRRGADVERCIRLGEDRTQADRAFHAAIVRAAHNEFMVRLLPMIDQAVSAAIVSGGHGAQLAEDTLRDHALLLEFLQKRDAAGAEHAMAIHMHHSIDVMGLGEETQP